MAKKHIIYVAEMCHGCDLIKEEFKGSAKITLKDISKNKAASAEFHKLGGKTVPALKEGNKIRNITGVGEGCIYVKVGRKENCIPI